MERITIFYFGQIHKRQLNDLRTYLPHKILFIKHIIIKIDCQSKFNGSVIFLVTALGYDHKGLLNIYTDEDSTCNDFCKTKISFNNNSLSIILYNWHSSIVKSRDRFY